MGRLSATSVKATKEPGRYGDGDGLYLVVTPSGRKSWVCRVQKNGKRRDIGLGSVKKVPLALARERAVKTRMQVEVGIDPVSERRKEAGIPTFREAVSLVFAENKASWKNQKHRAQWLSTLERYAFPIIGDLSISELDGHHARDVVAPIWLEKPETARRVAKDYVDKGVSRHGAYRVIQANEARNVVTLQDERGRELSWHPRQWGATQAQVYREEALELRVGDRVQFTRNDKAAKRVNGQLGDVIAIDPDRGFARVKLQGNRIEAISLERARDRHLSHAYVSTAFAAQGRTADRVFVNAESSAAHLLEQKSFYVALSRAKAESVLYTDERSKMQLGLQERAGISARALKERRADMQDGKQKAQEKAQDVSLAL